MRDEQRPWLIVLPPKIEDLTPITLNSDGVDMTDEHYCFKAKITFEIINTGPVPATNVRILTFLEKRYIEQDDEEMQKITVQWVQEGGRMLYEMGVRRFFETYTERWLSRASGRGAYTIGQNRSLEYLEPIGIIKISKELSAPLSSIECPVIAIAYQGPGNPKFHLSQFAFDLCGIDRLGTRCPPGGNDFAEGKGVFYRQAESHVS